ncbi:hypothetical protein DPMN_167137 [Dreissena polymorpha]|uniref:Uncharacterized protein n=1 Tax=Dreissena polymorpha TaxID=45954 RepID=A0A9D4F068_DREPO|nr:hypothetical protein DPMN_167137 [Dreissena polymorpha]
MSRSTGPQVLHPQEVDISRDASESCRKTRKEGKNVNNSRTRAAKVKAKEEKTEVNRSVKRSIIADKQNYIETLETEVEEASYQNKTKDMYSITKR